jgi:hypothetical protein
MWHTLSATEKVESFKAWLVESYSRDTLLFFDDIDGLPTSAIEEALPQGLHGILLTTRNPTLVSALLNESDLDHQHLRIGEMDAEDMVEFIKQVFSKTATEIGNNELHLRDEQLEAISTSAAHHPLVASRIISYILRDMTERYGHAAIDKFVSGITTWGSEEHVALLSHKPPLQCSIRESFLVSRMRLCDPSGPAWTLMKLISFLSLENYNFHQFLFLERPWINKFKDKLFYSNVWSSKHGIESWMSEIAQVSFGSRQSSAHTLHFHPMLVRCVQAEVGSQERILITKDILLLAYESKRNLESISGDKANISCSLVWKQARHCKQLCEWWQISRQDHNLPDVVHDWVDQEQSGTPSASENFNDIEESGLCSAIERELSVVKS